MNCEEIQRRITEAEPPFAGDIVSHLSGCEDCRVFADRDLRVRAWMRLKAREAAGPEAADRVARQVRLAIAATRPDPLWRLWTRETALPWLARAVAAAALIVGISALWRAVSRTPPTPSVETAPAPLALPDHLRRAPAFLPDHRLALQPDPVTNPIHPWIRLAPANEIQYGMPGSRFVNWER